VSVRYSAQDHSGYAGEQLTTIKGGKAEYIGTPYTTDDKDAPVAPFTGSAVAPPANGIPAT